MKNIYNPKQNRDAIAEAHTNKYFLEFSKIAKRKIRLANEIFQQRNRKGLSQQELARKVGTTQKIVSKIENGDMNVGFDLLSRFIEFFNLNSEDLANIFSCSVPLYSGTPVMKSENSDSSTQHEMYPSLGVDILIKSTN